VIAELLQLIEDGLKKLIYGPPAVAALDATVTTTRTVQSGGSVRLTEWAVVAALAVAAFFLKRMVAKVDCLSDRMTAAEVHQEDCAWNKGGRRAYDPSERVGVQENV